ncbi:hypothetical protein DYB28_000100 [Aphanomyces astaci]|uniref:Uncharacterized protein n=1 Tax=Aphanomyces astaci TaxID=112090 RepID=A0A397ACG5_APHAT|nr:hypothetical protein DYB36_007424 [Aphanomyces astaci]RHZ13956.1 hypothetical protein DYB26_003119 [Aphanomyces astaci]RLO06956.1 hypothetical protein DYB28_000100 [Aphanomyces astaci]
MILTLLLSDGKEKEDGFDQRAIAAWDMVPAELIRGSFEKAFKTSSLKPPCPFISQHEQGPIQEESHRRRVQQPGPAPLDPVHFERQAVRLYPDDCAAHLAVCICIPVWEQDDLRHSPPAEEGPKRVYTDISERIQAIPQSRRTCFCSIPHAPNIPKSTLHVYFLRGVIVKYSSVFKPSLAESRSVG